jgi:hypothetical protein
MAYHGESELALDGEREALQATLIRAMHLPKAFIRLPYAFDAARLAEEVAALPEQAWMAHPSGMAGNSAVPLISRNGGNNDEFDGPMSVTPHLRRCPYVMQVMASFGEILGRSRLMRLAPGCEVVTHVDFNYHWYTRVRIHVPVVTDPSVIFYCADEAVHMGAGQCWVFDSWSRHRVINGGDRDRVHLVFDTSGSSRFWRMLAADQNADADPRRGSDANCRMIPFDPNLRAVVETERYNAPPVMSPGEIDGLIADLLRDFAGNPRNDATLVDEYTRLLTDFAKDWRETWHRYGYETRGWPNYRRLIDTVRQGLHPNPRALLLQSNDVGVNPVIVQRILKAALTTDTLDQFVGSGA